MQSASPDFESNPLACVEQELFGNDMQLLGNNTPAASSSVTERQSVLHDKRAAYEQAKAEVNARDHALITIYFAWCCAYSSPCYLPNSVSAHARPASAIAWRSRYTSCASSAPPNPVLRLAQANAVTLKSRANAVIKANGSRALPAAAGGRRRRYFCATPCTNRHTTRTSRGRNTGAATR